MSTTEPIRTLDELYHFKNYYRQIAPDKRNYLLIILGLNTALRISDILNLRYSHIYDFEKNCLKSHIELTEKKTGKKTLILINSELKKVLSEFCPPSTDDYLFCSNKFKEQPLSRYQAYRIIKKAAAYAGLSDHISCHSLRKTFGYHAWKQGVPPAMLMNIYNHSSYQITRRYLGIMQDDKDDVYQKIIL